MEWSILASVPEPEARELLAVARRRVFARGEVVFHREDLAETLHLVAAGRFSVRVVTPLGDVATLGIVGPGGFFGELALLEDTTRRTATVAALERGETRSILKVDFDRLRHRHPQVANVLIGALAERVSRLSDQLVEALYLPAEARVLRRLCELGRQYGDEAGAVLPLTQEEIATFCGTSRATANGVLRDAERRGELRLHRGRTTLLDPAALARRAGRGGMPPGLSS